MSKETDIQKSARLVVESFLLTVDISYLHGNAALHGTRGKKQHRVYKRSCQRLERRRDAFDAMIANPDGARTHTYVGGCNENTTPQDHRCIMTDEWNVIHFDILEFGKRATIDDKFAKPKLRGL